MRHTTQGFTAYIFMLLLTISTNSNAWSLGKLFGPSVDDVAYSYTWRYLSNSEARAMRSAKGEIFLGGDGVLISIVIKNNSDYYLHAADLSCSMFDKNGNRIVKDQKVFFSGKANIAPGNSMTWSEEISAIERDRYSGVAGLTCNLVDIRGEK